MHSCPSCGAEDLTRVHRTRLQKCLYQKLYQCKHCGSIDRRQRTLLLWFGGLAKCPLCGDQQVTKATKRERDLVLYWNPINLAQALIGAKLYTCSRCGLQFYDRRAAAGDPASNHTATTVY
jgi:predicted RNA-binding Zn-ribbon protein involved in translation (DUF1610 family)